MTLGNIVDQLHDEHRLTDTSTTEKSDLTTLHVRLQEVDDLDTSLQHLLVGGEILKLRSLAVDGVRSLHIERFHTIDRLTNDIHHTALDLIASRHGDRTSRTHCLQSTLQSVRVVHGNATHSVLANVLLHLDDEVAAIGTLYAQCLIDFRQYLLRILALSVEINVDHRADNLRDMSNSL